MTDPSLPVPARPGALRRLLLAAGFVVLGLVLLHPRAVAAQPGTTTTTARPAPSGPSITTNDAPTLDAARSELTPAKAVVLGVVEGVTEFLPVSSTGHLLVVDDLLGIGKTDATKEAADAYDVVIQGGAIVAVLLVYWPRVVQMVKAVPYVANRNRTPPDEATDAGRRLLVAIVVAFLPAAVVGALFEKKIKGALFAPWPIVVAWVVGGLALILLARSGRLAPDRRGAALTTLTYRQAAIIGGAQCLALWPGTSRSLVTIIAATLLGLTLSAAVEFSFLLGLITLGAATAFDAAKSGRHIVENYGVVSPAIGFAVAAGSAFVAVRWMVGYLQRHDVAVFGYYRLAVAAGTAALLLTNVI